MDDYPCQWSHSSDAMIRPGYTGNRIFPRLYRIISHEWILLILTEYDGITSTYNLGSSLDDPEGWHYRIITMDHRIISISTPTYCSENEYEES